MRRYARFPVLLLLASGLFPAAEAAAETDADFSKYCRTTFPNSGPTTRAPSGAIAHYCNQGGTLQGIDLARACELTTGSRAYRRSGDRILCEDGPGPVDEAASDPLTAGDFTRYCREKFPNSSYQATPGNFSGNHSCRRVGGTIGFTLQPIDLADACRTLKDAGAYREEGGRVTCQTGGGAPTAERRAAGASGPRRDNTGTDRPATPDSNGGDNGPDNSSKAADRPRPSDTTKPDSKATAGRPEGVWEMTVGILPGMKVRFDWSSDDTMTGAITELPPEAAATAKAHYDLSVGDHVVVGRMKDGKFQLRTRLGVVGLRKWLQATCPGSLAVYDEFVANRWSLPGWFPVYKLTQTDSEIKGQHGGNEFIGYRNNPLPIRRCVLYGDPFNPVIDSRNQTAFDSGGGAIRAPVKVDPSIRVPRYAVKFELKSVTECREAPLDGPPLGLTELFNDLRDQARDSARAQLGQGRP